MKIEHDTLRECAAKLYWRALRILPPDVLSLLEKASEDEDDPRASEILESMLENCRRASEGSGIICQDTGIPVFLVEIGKNCSFRCDPFRALSAGIEEATVEHSLRANCVDVFRRNNSGTNTGKRYPVVHFFVGQGEGARVTLLVKGSGSEGRSRLGMLDPVRRLDGIRQFVLETVVLGAAKSCPPIVLGVGMGGSFDTVALLSKRALARPLGEANSDPELASLEKSLLEDTNLLGIGPMGLGGSSTALWISIESADTHITLNPVSVNMGCWAHRRAEAVLTEDGFDVVDGS